MLPDILGRTSEDIQHHFKVYGIQMELAQYPILRRQIRAKMRQELFSKGIITVKALEAEVKEKAILSQQREGVSDPFTEEPESTWQERLDYVREQLTDFYFAYNVPHDRLEEIIQSVLAGRMTERNRELELTFNPELAPWYLLFAKGEEYESLPPKKRDRVQHHLQEILVVLIKGMISDRLEFVGVAKKLFTICDLKDIWQRRIGRGKIGGKAAGMLLARKILQTHAPEIAQQIVIPNSYFIGADVFYDFLSINSFGLINQKYKTQDQIRAEYPKILAAYESGRFPEEIADRLREILRQMGKKPLIIRSSSLLEDNLGTSFAGKYASYFCPNQGTLKENLAELMLAIRRVYASVYNPDALFYRQRMGLIDYDERMAILLQEVQGQSYHQYYFPTLAGVAFSYSPVVWSQRLRREEGFVRLVMGMGTRAVERVGEDYPRLITLSHPTLRPEATAAAIKRYSQRLIDLIDMEKNQFITLPAFQVLNSDYPPLKWIASKSDDDTLTPLSFLGYDLSPEHLVLTFDNLLRSTNFAPLMKNVLSTLSRHYQSPVDVEFAVTIPDTPRPQIVFHLLQCRPQSSTRGEVGQRVPTDLPEADQLFLATRLVPQGQVKQVEYIVYVDPVAYSQIADEAARREIGRVIGRLNKALEGRNFILMGPGRWGSSNIHLGVQVSYADIYNARALVELAIRQAEFTPEPSYGTHFFQDLVEAHIYPLAIYPEEPDDSLNQAFLAQAKNHLRELLPGDARSNSKYMKIIHVPSERQGQHLEIAMDGKKALAYFAGQEQPGITDR